MSIYIKGMEMPDRCFSCPLNAVDSCGISRGAFIEYRDVDIGVAMNSRPDWCPLIPVPEHGDLIEREKLVFEDDYYGWRDKQVVKAAPTIIPAD